jgi:uncharacterized protein YqfB (UPF0267 family)
MDSKTQTKKGMKVSSKTRVKVAGLINDLHLLQSLPGSTTEVAKNYRLGTQFMKYLKELDVISTKNNTVLYVNPKNHSTEYILDYVMSRYLCDYGKEIKADTPSDNPPLLAVDIKKASRLSLKDLNLNGAAQEIMYKNEIRNLQSDLNRQEACIYNLQNELQRKYDLINELTKKKSIFARIKNLFQ